MVSRALFKDGLGNPTTITLDVGEVLIIYYTFTCRFKRKISATVTIKGVETLLEFYMHYHLPTSMQSFPFGKNNCFGAGMGGTNLFYTGTSFADPNAFTVSSTAGWTLNQNRLAEKTPLNTATGLKVRRQIALIGAVSSTLTGLAFTPSTSAFNYALILKITPSFNKTDLDVINFETINVISRA